MSWLPAKTQVIKPCISKQTAKNNCASDHHVLCLQCNLGGGELRKRTLGGTKRQTTSATITVHSQQKMKLFSSQRSKAWCTLT
jgi:hypothetical protein